MAILFVMMFIYDKPRRLPNGLTITVNRTCGILPPNEDDEEK